MIVRFLLLLEQFRVDIVCEVSLESTCQKRTAFMCPVDAITMKETIRRIQDSIEQGEKIQHMSINTMIILRMVEDPEFMHLSRNEVINADGIGVVWASNCWVALGSASRGLI